MSAIFDNVKKSSKMNTIIFVRNNNSKKQITNSDLSGIIGILIMLTLLPVQDLLTSEAENVFFSL